MSLTFGYDLKDGDKILDATNQLSSILRQFAIPRTSRGAILNVLPFCAVSIFFSCVSALSHAHGRFQCVTSLHGSRISATNH